MSKHLLHILPVRLLALLFILFSFTKAEGQLNAAFTADNTRGCPPFVVQFTDQSTGNPTSYFWDLGNGNTSTQRNPSTIYFNPGSYTVKLVVKNGANVDSVIKTQYIFVSGVPVVDFTADKTSGCSPFFVKFTDNTFAGSGVVASWQWDFGDGTSSTLQSPGHVYTTTGDFNVTLRIVNSNGCVATLTKPQYIHVDPSPIADFTSASTTSCNPPVTIAFSNTSTGSFTSSLWNFGDGTTATTTNPSHTYNTAGTYNVTLIVTNSLGCSDTTVRATVVGSVSADFTAPDTACEGASVVFTNTSSGTVSSFWTFGDGTTSMAIDPVKVYNTSGTYTVKLVNNFGACKDSVTKSIVIIKGPVANFTFTAPPAGCKVPVTVNFTSTSTGATSYLWNFGDSTTSTAANPTHTYTALGSYSVTLIVRNANGCTDTIVKPNIISIAAPDITGFNNLPFLGCAPRSQTFSANISSPEPVASYLWNFGDSTTSTAQTPTHNYTTAGIYNVSLKITTVNGCTDTFTYRGAIIVGEKPTANFSATPRVACASEPIKFTDKTTGAVDNWLWLFGDNTSSGEQNPQHFYKDTGYFDITLIAGNFYCFDTITITNYIYIKPPVSRFEIGFSCDTPFVRRFTDRSIGALTVKWNFGDGKTSTARNPVHTYTLPGKYYIELFTTNGSCTDRAFDSVNIIDEHPDFTVDSLVCKRTIVTFTATNVNTANIAAYTWFFGDGIPPTTTASPSITRRYLSSGTFSPTLITTDLNGCRDTVTHPVSVTSLGPTAAFTNPDGACVNTQVTFTDKTTPFGGYGIQSWTWSWGDGNTQTFTSPPFRHSYSAPGKYNVRLVVVDSFGCSDTLTRPDAVTITQPAAAFKLKDTIVCQNSNLTIINTSAGVNPTYAWNFGDGGTSNLKTPLYAYSSTGVYNIVLKVTDRYGCTDSVLHNVTVANADADFGMSHSVISCPPAQIFFYNRSKFASAVRWDFDDGGFSTIDSPSHFFSTAGTFNIKLVAFGYGGCKDSIIKPLVVEGPMGTFSYSPLLKCVPATVNFSASAVNTNFYTWDFGDGTTVITRTPSISHTYNSQGKFVPKLLLQDTTINCTVPVIGTDTIFITGVLAYIKSFRNSYCDSASIRFFDSSVVQYDTISSYNWSFGDGGTSTVKNPIHNYTSTGTYSVLLTVSTTGGCTDTAASQVRIVATPQVSITGPPQVCVNTPVSFTGQLAQLDTTTTWKWNFGDGDTSTAQNPPPQVYTTAGLFGVRVTVVNSTGCRDTATVPFRIDPLPPVNAGPDSTICRGQSITLTPSGAQLYSWQSSPTLSCSNCTSPVASPATSSVYLVEGTSAQGCKNKDSVAITVIQPGAITVSKPDTICDGEKVTLSASGAGNYIWSPATGLDNPTSASPVANPDTTTVYQVIGSDARNCFTDTATVTVTVYPIPQFNIVPDNVTIPVGNSVPLTTTNSADIIRWQWDPVNGLSCSACPQPVASPVATTTYTAIASNAGGCIAQDKVTVELTCGGGNLYVPNTFSPNKDGMNDVFYPRGNGISGIKLFRVFNRWGALVYQRSNLAVNDPLAGWDGTYKGQLLTPDVFVYYIEVICANGSTFNSKGNVTLIR